MVPLPLKLSGKVIITDAEGRVLLLRRALSSRHHGGKWEFPGGKNDPGEDFESALHREVAEETALQVEFGRVVGAGESRLPDRRVAYLFIEGRVCGGELRLSDEHDAFAWIPRRELTRQDLSPQFRAVAAAYAAEEVTPPDVPAARAPCR